MTTDPTESERTRDSDSGRSHEAGIDLEIPPIGLGTYSSDDRDQWVDNVETAFEVGYRHVDTAQVYENEEYVGRAIANADVDREAIVLATKTVHHDVPERPEDVGDAIDGCLDRLGVEYVDLLYVHWPSGIYDHETVLPQFDEACEAGKTRAIGLSNFSPELIDEAREVLEAPVSAVQVEMHPLLQQEELLAYVQDNDMTLVAYAPLARGEVFDEPAVRAVADEYDITPAQVSLAWLLSKENVVPIPKASSREHMEENLAALDVELDDDAIARLDAIDREHRVFDSDWGPWNW